MWGLKLVFDTEDRCCFESIWCQCLIHGIIDYKDVGYVLGLCSGVGIGI